MTAAIACYERLLTHNTHSYIQHQQAASNHLLVFVVFFVFVLSFPVCWGSQPDAMELLVSWRVHVILVGSQLASVLRSTM